MIPAALKSPVFERASLSGRSKWHVKSTSGRGGDREPISLKFFIVSSGARKSFHRCNMDTAMFFRSNFARVRNRMSLRNVSVTSFRRYV